MRRTPRRKAKYEDYKQYINLDGALALGSGWMGIDFGRYAPDEPLRHIETNAVQSSVEAFSSADPGKIWTVRELAEWIGIGGLGPLFVGGPQTVADLLEEWVEDTDVDGFNLAYAVTHETFSDIVDASRSGTAEARRLQARLRAGNIAREAVRRGTALAAEPYRRAVPRPCGPTASARRGGMRDESHD